MFALFSYSEKPYIFLTMLMLRYGVPSVQFWEGERVRSRKTPANLYLPTAPSPTTTHLIACIFLLDFLTPPFNLSSYDVHLLVDSYYKWLSRRLI